MCVCLYFESPKGFLIIKVAQKVGSLIQLRVIIWNDNGLLSCHFPKPPGYLIDFPVLYSRSLLVIYFIHSSVYMSIPISQIIPPSPPLSPLVKFFILFNYPFCSLEQSFKYLIQSQESLVIRQGVNISWYINGTYIAHLQMRP